MKAENSILFSLLLAKALRGYGYGYGYGYEELINKTK